MQMEALADKSVRPTRFVVTAHVRGRPRLHRSKGVRGRWPAGLLFQLTLHNTCYRTLPDFRYPAPLTPCAGDGSIPYRDLNMAELGMACVGCGVLVALQRGGPRSVHDRRWAGGPS